LNHGLSAHPSLDLVDVSALDTQLRDASVVTLREHLPRLIHASGAGIGFGERVEGIANRAHATAGIVKEALHELFLSGARRQEGPEAVDAGKG
jgi:hypothetical protein